MTIKQLSVFIENKTGRINEVTRILAENGINMTAFSLAESTDFGILRLIVSDVEKAGQVLKDHHFGISVTDVVGLCLSNRPGSLAQVLDLLARDHIFIEYMYAFSQGDKANVVIRPTDIEKCIAILEKNSDKCDIIKSNSL